MEMEENYRGWKFSQLIVRVLITEVVSKCDRLAAALPSFISVDIPTLRGPCTQIVEYLNYLKRKRLEERKMTKVGFIYAKEMRHIFQDLNRMTGG